MRSIHETKVLPIFAAAALFCFAASSPALAESKSVAIDVSVTVAPLFQMEVTGPNGGNIEFGVVHKNPDGAVTVDSGDVIIRALTNKRKPYQITQMLVSPLENSEGAAFGSTDMKSYARSEKPASSLVNGDPVWTSPGVLFRSTPEGLSNVITANYKLDIRPEQAPGDYKTKLVYTITTL